MGRGMKGATVALALRTGEIRTYEEAAEQIIENALTDAPLKLIMAFYRRFMLLNMGDPNATMFAVVVASIEEASIARARAQKDLLLRLPPRASRVS